MRGQFLWIECFGADVRQLIIRLSLDNLEFSTLNVMSGVMTFDVDAFGSLSDHWIFCNLNASLVVFVNDLRVFDSFEVHFVSEII